MQEEIPRYAAVAGLGFGDCGKGLFVDFLTRRWRAHTVVRFNGGAQAGHNVVLPDGRHHTFSQFGAGTFVPGASTVLASPVVVHPSALLVETAYLERVGVRDALQRLLIDARCRINTPFHQAAGRLRELLRGKLAHGSCGIGFGETISFGIRHPELSFSYTTLHEPKHAQEIAEAIRLTLLDEMMELCHDSSDDAVREELRLLGDPEISARWLAGLIPLLERVRPSTQEQLAEHLQQDGSVLFEGAQGALLDEDYGFHPHTTWSNTRVTAANNVLEDLGIRSPILKLGVLRSYLTRHGAGPFPTHDTTLNNLSELHNDDAGWQGAFRRGHPDLVLLRYACEINGGLDGLLLSHLDVFESGLQLRACNAYTIPGHSSAISHLPLPEIFDVPSAIQRTEQIFKAVPCYEKEVWRSASDCIARISDLAKCPVMFGAHGSNYLDIW